MASLPQILTANRLRDGDVVYWRGGSWVTSLADAELFPDDAAAEAVLKAADAFVKGRQVVNPYLFDVRIAAGEVKPVKEREIIRAAGPTVRPDLANRASASGPTMYRYDEFDARFVKERVAHSAIRSSVGFRAN